MTSLALAWRTARRYRARTLLAIAGVAVIGALLFDMLLLSRGLLLSFADLLNSAGFDLRIVSGEGIANARVPIVGTAQLVTRLEQLPEVGRISLVRLETAEIGSGNRAARAMSLVGTSGSGDGAWRLIKGSTLGAREAAAERCPLVITPALASELQLRPGSAVTVSVRKPGVESALPAVPCRVAGVAAFAFASSGDLTAATTMDAFRDALGERGPTDADFILIASRQGVGAAAAARAIARVVPDLRVYSNDDVVEQFNRNGFAYFRQISLVLSSLTMVFAFLLVATLLTVSINQRLGEIAALRALGIGRTRISATLLWESALLVGAGGLLALPLAAALALVLDRILRQMPGIPERLHFFVFEPRALGVHLALLAVTALAAAAYPIWLTARLPIAATLRREVVG